MFRPAHGVGKCRFGDQLLRISISDAAPLPEHVTYPLRSSTRRKKWRACVEAGVFGYKKLLCLASCRHPSWGTARSGRTSTAVYAGALLLDGVRFYRYDGVVATKKELVLPPAGFSFDSSRNRTRQAEKEGRSGYLCSGYWSCPKKTRGCRRRMGTGTVLNE